MFIDVTLFFLSILFHQVVTTSAVKHGVSFDIAYFILHARLREVFVTAFRNFKIALGALQKPLSLEPVRTDFELALIQVFLFVFPGVWHRGCHFHFAQTIRLEVQELGDAKACDEKSL